MGTMEAANGIPFEAIRPGGRWVAPLPSHHRSHCPPRPRHRHVDVWTATLGFHPPHAIEGVLKQPPGKWISNARLTHYQALLPDAPRVRFQTPCFLNLATLYLTQRKTGLSMIAVRYWLRPWRHKKT